MEQNLLSQLRDIHLPESGGFWPPAPGWWVLAALALVLLMTAALLLIRWRRRNRWRRAAHRKLEQLARNRSPSPHWFAQLNALLKQCARVCYPHEHPEAMSGTAWAEFLLRTSPKDRIASRPTVEAMITSSWQPTPTGSPEEALAFARMWLGGQSC